MPSLADIPQELLHRDYKARFVIWLRTLGVDLKVKAELSALWQRECDTTLSLEDHETIIGSRESGTSDGAF